MARIADTPVVIEAAINGETRPDKNPNVPRKPEEIGAEMDRILSEAGYTEGTRSERMQKLGESPAQRYPDTDEGRAQILKDYEAMISEITAGLDPYFGIKPKAKSKSKK